MLDIRHAFHLKFIQIFVCLCCQGVGINFSNLTRSTMFSLVFGEDVSAKKATKSEARYIIVILIVLIMLLSSFLSLK